MTGSQSAVLGVEHHFGANIAQPPTVVELPELPNVHIIEDQGHFFHPLVACLDKSGYQLHSDGICARLIVRGVRESG